jgi:hypothetical protein
MPSFSKLGLLKTMITAHHTLPDYRSMQRKSQSAASILITYVLFLGQRPWKQVRILFKKYSQGTDFEDIIS